MKIERQIILDNRFLNGFAVKPQMDGDNEIIGYLTYDDKPATAPTMVLAQWYCGYWNRDEGGEYARHNILNGERKCAGSLYEWRDASKRISLDRMSGKLELELDASREYSGDRKLGEPWPHILVEYQTEVLPLCGVRKMELELDFCLRKAECRMNREDPDLHTAQFVWYAILKNNNKAKKDYGKYIWFGCTLYDSRFEQTPFSATVDGGKEVNTGMLIYKPASEEYLSGKPKIGEVRSIRYDITDRMSAAYEEACKQGLLADTDYSDLAITGGNIGWEVTGTYDVCMQVEKMALNVRV